MMSRQYSPKSFLRRAPNALLKRYLAQHGIGADLPWQYLSEMDVDQVFEAIEAAPESVRREIDRDFREIEAMADEGGVKTLIDEAREPVHSLDLAETLAEMGSHMERAFWVFLEHRRVFHVAKLFHYADNLGRWRKRDGLPVTQPADRCRSLQEAGQGRPGLLPSGRGAGEQANHGGGQC